MAWSMRTPPACRMHARSVAMNGANPPRAERARRKCRQSPILASAVVKIGRCADLQADQHILLLAPCGAATTVHADGKIGDEADAHAGVRDFLLRSRKRAISEPLQKRMKENFAFVLLGEIAAPMGCAGSRHSARPSLPIPIVWVHLQSGCVQRFK